MLYVPHAGQPSKPDNSRSNDDTYKTCQTGLVRPAFHNTHMPRHTTGGYKIGGSSFTWYYGGSEPVARRSRWEGKHARKQTTKEPFGLGHQDKDKGRSPLDKGRNMTTTTQHNHKPIHYSKYDSHCGLTACGCDHARCFKGWVDNTAGTWPCLYCRENLTSRLMRAQQARDQGYPQESISRIIMNTKR